MTLRAAAFALTSIFHLTRRAVRALGRLHEEQPMMSVPLRAAGSVRLRLLGAAAMTALAAPGAALAIPLQACGPLNVASDPQTVTCTGAFNPYANGIAYNTSASPTPGNVQVKLSATANVQPTTTSTGLSVIGPNNFYADAQLLTGAQLTATGVGVSVQAGGAGAARIENSGTVSAVTSGLLAQAGSGGSAVLTNNADGSVSVSNAGDTTALSATGGSASISNLGSASAQASGSGRAWGALVNATNAAGLASLSNTGQITVSAAGGQAVGLAASPSAGGSSLTTNGTVSVTGGAGGAAGLSVTGGLSAVLTAASTASGAASLSVSASGSAVGVLASGMSGNTSVNLTGVALSPTSTGADAAGVSLSGGAADVVTVAPAVFGATTYGADMTVSGKTSAMGVGITSPTASATVSFTSAALNVAASAGGATGVALTGVAGPASLSFTPGARGAGLTVTAAGGDAYGALVSGTGAQSAVFGDTVSVANTSGRAIGLDASGGSSLTASFAKALTANATGGHALGVNIVAGGGASSVSLADLLTVSSNGGDATGVSMWNGASQSVATGKAVSVTSATGSASGLWLAGATGTVSATVNDSLTVSGASTTIGVNSAVAAGGTAETVTLTKGVSASSTGSDAFGVLLNGGASAALSLHTSGGAANVISASSTGSSAPQVTGVQVYGGASVTVDGAPTVNVSGTGFTLGAYVENAVGPVNLTLGQVTAQSTTTSAPTVGVAAFTSGASAAISLADAGVVDVTGAGANYGAIVRTTGTSGAINLNLNTVRLHGSASTGQGWGVWAWNQTSGASTTTVTVQSVQTSGRFAVGVFGAASTGGAATLNLGSAGTGGVATTGANSPGVDFVGQNGLLTINNNGLVSTQGASSFGIRGTSTGLGGVTIASAQTTTAGASSAGLIASTSSGAASVSASSVSTQGAASHAISVSTGTGAATVTATTATAAGAGSDAIHVASSGAAADTVTVSDGGVASSTNGYGVYVATGGAATVNVGTSANTASVSGGLWGVAANATGGTSLTIKGQVTGGGGAAINLQGGADVIVNAGVVNGYVSLSGGDASFTNAGTWNAFGGTEAFGGGTNVLVNSGALNAAPSATTAAVTSFTGLTTVTNTGLINLQQAGASAHTGDVLELGAAAYSGSGAAKLAIDANLAAAAVGGSAAQSADLLRLTGGSTAGTTTLAVADLGAGKPGAFNFTGIAVVSAASSTAGAFVLQGGVIDKGYVQYSLAQSGGTYYLVGLPSTSSFEITRTGAEAQRFWRRSSDLWAEEMRSPRYGKSDGLSSWAAISGASDKQKDNPTYTVTAVNSFTFKPNLAISDDYAGGETGIDFGHGDWGLGLAAGYGRQTGRFSASANGLDLDGYNLGGYVRYRSMAGVFLNALAKYDSFSVKQSNHLQHFGLSFDGSTTGAEFQLGYHWTGRQLFVEPVATMAWTSTDLGSFTNAAAGASVNFNRTRSAYGTLGLRFGAKPSGGDWALSPFGGVYYEGEMGAKNRTTVTAGPASVLFADPRPGADARFELGLSGRNKQGLELNALVDGRTGGGLSGVTGRVGLSWRW